MKRFLKVQFISRDLPVKGGGGTSVYRLSLLRYLHSIGYKIEYLLLHYRGENYSIDDNPSASGSFFRVIRMRNDNEKEYPVWSDLPTLKEIDFLIKQVKRGKPDLLIVDHPWLGGLLIDEIKHKNLITAVLTHDVQYKKIKAFRKHGVNPYKRNKGHGNPYWDKELEKRLLSKADIILAIQKEDYRTFQKMLPAKQVIYLPMAAEATKRHKTEQAKGRCLFVGGSAQHNAFGLKWFLSDIWPIIINQHPLATLHICGEVYKEMDVEEYKKEPSIVFKGKVKNLAKEYTETQVCIIPLLVGSGLKIKLVEAMAYGKACVSTSIGTQGIEEIKNLGIIVADEKTEFANAVTELLQNETKRVFFGAINKQYASIYLTPTAVYGPLILKVMDKIKSNL